MHLLQLISGLAWIPIAISVTSGVRHLDSTYLRVARNVVGQQDDAVFQIILPASLAAMVSSLHLVMDNSEPALFKLNRGLQPCDLSGTNNQAIWNRSADPSGALAAPARGTVYLSARAPRLLQDHSAESDRRIHHTG